MANETDNNSEPKPESNGAVNGNPQAELRALNDVISALQVLPNNDVRERVLQAAAAFLRMSLAGTQQTSYRPANTLQHSTISASFSEDRTPSPKDFLIQKQPRTEVERVACLAYYLTHYRDVKHFKTIDISALNTDAAQPKFSNAAQAVDNALKTHYLTTAAKGLKQLSAAGEVFVQNLPDREAARSAMNQMKPRRRKKFGLQSTELEEISGTK